MKNIWIFNHHALTPDMSGGTRHFDFAKELVARGYKVTIFASSFHYSKYEELKIYNKTYFLNELYEGVEFVWIKTRPYKGNGLGRVLNMLDYMFKVQKIASSRTDTVDVVIGSSVHMFAVYAGYKIALKRKVPFVMEVRDIWPQTLIDMGVNKYHPFILLLGIMEKFLYKKADKIITNLPYAYKHIETFGVKRDDIVWISNGVDVKRSESIDPYVFEKHKFHVTYAGAIGQANQLETLIEAARELRTEKDVLIHIIGDGPLKKELERIKSENVIFHGSVAKKQAIAMIKGSDILFFPLADSPVFKFGISSNKLFDYLASKKPILFASNAKNNPIKEANAGISIAAGDKDAIVKSIIKLKKLDVEERANYGKNGYKYVSEHFSITTLIDKLEDCLSSLEYNPNKNENM